MEIVDGLADGGNVETIVVERKDPTEIAAEIAAEVAEKSNIEKQDEFLRRIKQEFNLSKSGYQQLLNQMTDIKSRLEKVSEDKLTLKDQMGQY